MAFDDGYNWMTQRERTTSAMVLGRKESRDLFSLAPKVASNKEITRRRSVGRRRSKQFLNYSIALSETPKSLVQAMTHSSVAACHSVRVFIGVACFLRRSKKNIPLRQNAGCLRLPRHAVHVFLLNSVRVSMQYLTLLLLFPYFIFDYHF
jgi:hypothetical protein